MAGEQSACVTRFTFADGQLAQGLGAFVNHYADDVLPFALVVSACDLNSEIIES